MVAFAELEQFIDSPLRTYSSGMQMRLAFSVAAFIEPEILLIDEVLAVGDLAFQRKCLERIQQFKQHGCTILLVSNDLGLIERLSDEVIWLKSGRIAIQGPASQAVGEFKSYMQNESRSAAPLPKSALAGKQSANRFGSFELEILDVHLIDEQGFSIAELKGGQPLRIEMALKANSLIENPIFTVSITRQDGTVCLDTNTEITEIAIPRLKGEAKVRLTLARLDLSHGLYYVDVGAFQKEWAYPYDYHWQLHPLTVMASAGGKGLLSPPQHWEIQLSDSVSHP
jgi:lipopolysaccharide transport system ATP-binding protein